MKTRVPLKSIVKLALMTSPFIAIMGATPGFLIGESSTSFILGSVLFIMTIAMVMWAVNVSILELSYSKPKLNRTWVRITISSIIISLIIITIFLILHGSSFIEKLPRPLPTKPLTGRFALAPLTQGFAFNVMIFTLLELLLLREQRNSMTFENEQLKIANMEAKFNSLKEQLHPHFLFNSLSTLKSLIKRSPERAEIYLDQLSDLLRFSTSNTKPVIPLLSEISLCEDYLNMQKVRFGDALIFNFDIPKQVINESQVPVYSLQQLAENAIKHNILTMEQPLKIEICYNSLNKEIIIINNLQSKPAPIFTTSTGLSNLNERYQLLGYKGINIQRTQDKYSVGIQLIKKI